MRRLLKFLHTLGAIGLMGAMACLLVLVAWVPPPSSLAQYALIYGVMGDIAKWIFLPSLVLTLIAGLLAIAATSAYQNAGWAWLKAATGLVVFEWSLTAVEGPLQQEAELSARVLAHQADAALLGVSLASERGTLWVLLAVATANVVLGIWRPRLMKSLSSRAPASDAAPSTEQL
jgi:hypothetical protein